ncbi:MAG: FCD domain-containing protein [Spirochaetales bacterium]|nr:FCD domain-containing protein [Spirochaetales bacterium]
MDLLNEPWKLKILETIALSEEPLGSWNLVNAMEEQGKRMSPATVGRILNELEKNGYLEKQSFKGRVITEKGLAIINTVQRDIKLEEHKKNLDELINSKVLQNFLMVLDARKAIERTTASLSAVHITDQELSEMEKILEKQELHHRDSISVAQDDIEFHSLIAKTSRNKALFSLYMIVSMMGQQSELFAKLRTKVGSPYMVSHRTIYEAIREHDSLKAEECMIHHIENLKHDVDTYWHEYADLL